MKKVLYVATVDLHIRTFHIPYLKLLHDNGYEVHVATNGDEQFPYCDVKHKISIERSPFKFRNLKAIRQLKKIIDKEKYDIIHCHTPMGSVVTRLAAINARKKGTRVIYTAHGFHFYKGAPKLNWILFYPIEKFLAKYTDTLITINKEDYSLAKNKFKKCKQIEYVPGVGIDEEKFDFEITEKEKNILKKSLGLKKDDFILIQVGELNENKNQIMAIKAMTEITKKYENIHLLLVGTGGLENYYNEKIKEYNLEGRIHLLGYRKDVPKLLKISDILLSLSHREGLPVNVIEAIFCGLPIIATSCRGNIDLVKNNKNGYVVDLNNNKNFVKKIETLYKDKQKYKEFKEYNKTEISKYTQNNVVCSFKKIYFVKNKILHLLASNKYSGAENVACTIINNMKEQYDLVYCSPEGSINETLYEKEINFIPLKKFNYYNIKKIIKHLKPDIIHAHDNRASVYAGLIFKKGKVISQIHGNNKIMNTFNLKSLLYKLISSRFYKIIWVSESSYNDYIYKDYVKRKSIILYNTIDQKEVIRKSNEYSVNKEYDLIFLGRLAYPKNVERLIEILQLLSTKTKNFNVAIVGDGVDRKKIENQVKNYNLEKNIKFFGHQKNPYPILKKSKILVMTSIYEGTPMSALEAQALGKPIIATPVDGLKNIVINDYNGYLTDDNEEFCNYILKSLDNINLKKLSNNSYVKFNEFNNINNYIKKINEIYLCLFFNN